MWRGILLVSALGILFPQPASVAQDVAEGEAKSLRLQKYVRLHVVAGRIAVQQRDLGQSRTVTRGQPESPYRQHLQLQVRPPCVVVQYEAVDPDGQLMLRLCERRKLVIERVSRDPTAAPSVRYEQPQSGPVTLAVTGQASSEFSAPSLWHLLLIQPQVCRDHLTPLLELLSPDWQLAQQADEIHEVLLAAAAEVDAAGQEKAWTRQVHDLASDNFSRRQAADAALRGGGHSAAAFLARLDSRTLCAEQRLRIDRIRAALADGSTDTPQRVATWLLGDRSIWLALLADPHVEKRIAAVEHMSRLTGRAIAFDPHGDEKTRQVQLAELSRRISVR